MMLNNIFGDMEYSIGWKSKKIINLFGKEYPIFVKIQARNPDQALPISQEQSCFEYINHESEYLSDIEEMLIEYCDSASSHFTPRVLLFKRNGVCALLLDDINDPDDGIAVRIIPEKNVVSQDMFL